MKKRKSNIEKILNKIKNIFSKRGYRNKEKTPKIIEEIQNREEGASLPPDLAEQYRKELAEKKQRQVEESFKKKKEFFEQRREEFNEQKSYRESVKLPEFQLPNHEKAKEDSEERRIREENRRINKELRYMAVELEERGIKRYSNKKIGDKFIIAYGKCKDNSDKVVIEYTRDELLEKSKQREQEQNAYKEE